MSAPLNIVDLELKARLIRCLIIKAVHAAASGHPGGPLGLADIFSSLYFRILNHRPLEPDWVDRDRLLISNGHVCAVRYAAMALSGYFPLKELLTFRQLGSKLQGHPSSKMLAGVENSGGSLGQGLSQAVGISLSARLQKKEFRTFVVISDGECGEGMTWEAAQAAVHYKAPVIALLDYNKIQIDGYIQDVCDLGDLPRKFEAAGVRVLSANGHSIPDINAALDQALNYTAGPQLIAFNTILGQGVSFMANDPGWHGKPPSDEQAERALEELDYASVRGMLGGLEN